MNKKLICAIFLLFSLSLSHAQTNAISKTIKVLSLVEVDRIEDRITSYNTGIHLADSMYNEYHATKFFLATETPGVYTGGLIWVRSLYVKSQSLRRKTSYCKEKISSIDEEIVQESKEEKEFENIYKKLLEKAEEYFIKKDYVKAKELYERALTFKPDDQLPKDRISEIESILKSKLK